jgi:hypothetical protein
MSAITIRHCRSNAKSEVFQADDSVGYLATVYVDKHDGAVRVTDTRTNPKAPRGTAAAIRMALGADQFAAEMAQRLGMV